MNRIFEISKGVLDGMRNRPRNLAKGLIAISALNDLDSPVTIQEFFNKMEDGDVNTPICVLFHQSLAGWDYVPSSEWNMGTARNTADRRARIYDVLGLESGQRVFCNEQFPYAPALDPPVIITDAEATGWKPWYTSERTAARNFYWTSYFEYLRDRKGWDPKNLAALEESSKAVVERLADPEWPIAYQSKGLVVGFVQSGKTANFTGVIARAADAGYRLIIVLAGTINILRDQTQRRLDKELVGVEMCENEPYELDEDYSEFVRYGGFPSERGSFDWERLTGSKDDFKRLKHGIAALEFRKADPSSPFFRPANLHRERARLTIVKKNTAVLNKVIEDLRSIQKRIDLSAVPALIIDDESDQASINTIGPIREARKESEKERKERSETNRCIVNLLKLLPRAQYVGYTATPFANVFIDPEDAEDLFPSDFIVALPKPNGYMGVREFYDDTDPTPRDYSFNQNAFVRFVEGPDDKPKNLVEAIDAFVLSGAMKLFREQKDGKKYSYRHHTMLVHNSPFVNAHAQQSHQVENLLTAANYAGGGKGLSRLRNLWEQDFKQVSLTRAPSLPNPTAFQQLLPAIGECWRRIDEGGKPVLIINGNNRDDSPNFEKSRVWKILVGGTKLSRGYTVEGLTVSYYRRRAGAADTLMQMGRWFGFRNGYKDLVRLYIGKNEPENKKHTKFINLYEAFRATCHDEEQFRAQLVRYSSPDSEGHITTPKQVPPLVTQHMLQPTSRNKMFNARITFKNLGGETRQKTVAPADQEDRKHNENLMKKLLSPLTFINVEVGLAFQKNSYRAIISHLNPDDVITFLNQYRWLRGHEKSMTEVVEFLGGKDDVNPAIKSWLFFAPQLKSMTDPWKTANQDFSVRERSRVIEPGGRYKVYSEPEHILAAEYFAGLSDDVSGKGGELRNPHQAVFLFYPVRSEKEKGQTPTMGFVLVFPENRIPKQIAYTVADPSRSEAVVIDIPRK
jgi:hypothetical protein